MIIEKDLWTRFEHVLQKQKMCKPRSKWSWLYKGNRGSRLIQSSFVPRCAFRVVDFSLNHDCEILWRSFVFKEC